MNNRFTGSGAKLTEEALVGAEKMLGRNVPDAYRSFLLKHNGGRPDAAEFQMAAARTSTTEPVAIKSFFGIGMPEGTLNLEYALETFGDRIPSWSFPIARDPGGSLILMAAEGPRKGKIYFWDHDREADDGDPPTEDNLYLIADSLDDFLAKLTES